VLKLEIGLRRGKILLQKSMLRLLSVADVVSLVNVIFGFLAIIMIYLDETRLGFSFILLALLADGLDGIVARKLSKSKLGDYFEAMGDITSMGVASALFVYSIYYSSISWCPFYHSYLFIVLIVFLASGVIRLASFHVMKDKKFFVGIPIPASTIIIVVLAYLGISFWIILPVILVVSLAMVSNVRFPKLGYRIHVVAVLLIFLTLIIDKIYYSIAPILLLLAIFVYAFFGPVYLWRRR